LRILDGAQKAPERILIYGSPKSAKTRLATALPWGEFWGEKAVYVAADPGAASLRSVLLPDRAHLIPVEPKPEVGRKYDPLHEAVEIATHDWKDAGTIIWDTLTATAEDVLAAYARLGNYAKDQITYGKPGTASFHAHPTMGDYGAAQNSVCEHLLGLLFEQPKHLIILTHELWVEPKNAQECIGGPATVGSATAKTLPGRFDTVIRCEAKKRGEPGKPKVTEFIAHTNPHGPWICGVRNPGVNLPDVVLGEDPRHFWGEYAKLIGGK